MTLWFLTPWGRASPLYFIIIPPYYDGEGRVHASLVDFSALKKTKEELSTMVE